ncbi:hypothetical protein NQZ68_039945 [Dissostichus eleginoides]|nr:hypothetical protein NQZ68_039945 [Dissostichus eleginoides]
MHNYHRHRENAFVKNKSFIHSLLYVIIIIILINPFNILWKRASIVLNCGERKPNNVRKMLRSLLFFSLIASFNTESIQLSGTETYQSSIYEDVDKVKYTSDRAIDEDVKICANTLEEMNGYGYGLQN